MSTRRSRAVVPLSGQLPPGESRAFEEGAGRRLALSARTLDLAISGEVAFSVEIVDFAVAGKSIRWTDGPIDGAAFSARVCQRCHDEMARSSGGPVVAPGDIIPADAKITVVVRNKTDKLVEFRAALFGTEPDREPGIIGTAAV